MTQRDELAYVAFDERPLHAHAFLLEGVGDARRVLDVGCSSGYLAERLSRQGARVIGAELDPAAAEEARHWCEEVLVGDVERMEFPFEPESFDAIVCGDLIEHLRDPGALLARLRPLLHPSGRLVLTTPNIANWAIRLSLLFGRFRYTDRGILDRTHAHLFTRKTLLETIREAGYEPRTVDFTVPLPAIDSRFADRVAHALGRVRPSLFAYQFVVTATPSTARTSRQ